MLVVSEERAHPAIRILARACIALAQERLAEQKQAIVETAESTLKDTGEPVLKEERTSEQTPSRTGKAATNTTKLKRSRTGVDTEEAHHE